MKFHHLHADACMTHLLIHLSDAADLIHQPCQQVSELFVGESFGDGLGKVVFIEKIAIVSGKVMKMREIPDFSMQF